MPPSLSRRRGFIAVAALLAATSALLGQQVRGNLVADSSGRPVPSAIVELLDSSGVAVVQTVSSGDGRFALTAPRPGSYRIRVRRIGFKSTLGDLETLAAGRVATITLRLPALTVTLAPVEVVGRDVCPAEMRGGSPTGDVWEEARKALLLTALARAEHRLEVRSERYSRDVVVSSRQILNEHVSVMTGDSIALFRSAPAEDLARLGYVWQQSNGVVYFAPDADVMLAESFAATHCFQLVPDPAKNDAIIGLRFTPTVPDTLPEVSGVLWLDRVTSELREMEFHFVRAPTGLPDDSLIGGKVGFEMLPSGWWTVNRWELRIPLVVARPHGRVMGFTLVRYREVGGRLLEAKESSEAMP